jgi:putative hydrolase
MYNITVDLHVHSIASGHAYSTVNELAVAAAACGLEAIAITDHGPGLPGGPHPYHFTNQERFHSIKSPCTVLSGVEEDLADGNGNVYLPDRILETLDVVLLGLHPYGWVCDQSAGTATSSLLKAMENPLIRGITHPVNKWIAIDVKEVVRGARESGTAIEFNISKITSLEPQLYQMLEWVEEFDAPLMINTDAHIVDEIGVWDGLEPFIDHIQPERVINRSLDSVIEFFNIDHPGIPAGNTTLENNS